MRSALVPILLNSVPGWVRNAYPGVWPTISLAAHFDTGNYWAQGLGQVSADTLFACTRASTKYVPNAAGVLVPIASGLLPIVVGTGNSIEQAASCLALWNRDLTNANWTASSVTPLKDQVGMDGVVNSASSLLATGTNGTLTAAGITSASASRTVTMGVMRLIGTGPVSISQDGGATFTAITTKVGAAWYIPTPTDFAGLTQTVTNPQIVIKLGTSGDKIAVDFVDLEAGAFNTSPIATTTVAVTRAADVVSLNSGAANSVLQNPVWIFAKTYGVSGTPSNNAIFWESGNSFRLLAISANTVRIAGNNQDATLGSGTWAGSVKTVGYTDASGSFVVANGGTAGTTASTENAAPSGTVYLGSNNGASAFNGFIQRFAVGNRVITSAQGTAMSAP